MIRKNTFNQKAMSSIPEEEKLESSSVSSFNNDDDEFYGFEQVSKPK